MVSELTPRTRPPTPGGLRRPVAAKWFGFAIVVLSLAVRVGILAANPGNAQERTFQNVAAAGKSALYTGTAHYNYSPVWAGVLRGVDQLSRFARIRFHIALGILYLLCDAATAILIGVTKGSRRGVLFFVNPVSIITSSWYLQFDTAALTFLIAAIITFDLPKRAGRAWSVVLLSLSLVLKHIAWFHPLLLLRRRNGESWWLSASPLLAYAVFAVSFLPYWRFWRGIREQVLRYDDVSREFGVATVPMPFWLRRAIFVAAACGAVWLLRRTQIARASLILFLVSLLTMPGVLEYYFVWPIALGALCGGGFGYWMYSAIVSLFMLGTSQGFNLQEQWHHLPDWSGPLWGTVLWLLWEIRRLKVDPMEQPMDLPRVALGEHDAGGLGV